MAHIRWSDCYNALGATVQDVRRTGSYSDVLLCVGGAVIPSHKLVLISASMYFKDLFENCVLDARSYVVIIPDCTVDEINALLDFMYLGECSGTREEISRILQIGARLKVRGMKESLLKESMEQNLLQESVEQKDQYNSLFPLAFNRSFMEHLQKAGHIPNPSFVLNTNGPNFNVGDAAATVQHQEEVASGPCNDDAAVPLTTRNTVPRRSNAASSNKRKSQSPPLKRRRVDSGKKDATAAPCPPLTPVVEESSVAATDDAAGVEDERAAVAQSEAQEDSAPLEEESSTTASHVVDHCLVKTEYQNDDNPPEALMNPKMELVCGDDNNQSAVNDFQHNSDCHSGTSVNPRHGGELLEGISENCLPSIPSNVHTPSGNASIPARPPPGNASSPARPPPGNASSPARPPPGNSSSPARPPPGNSSSPGRPPSSNAVMARQPSISATTQSSLELARVSSPKISEGISKQQLTKVSRCSDSPILPTSACAPGAAIEVFYTSPRVPNLRLPHDADTSSSVMVSMSAEPPLSSTGETPALPEESVVQKSTKENNLDLGIDISDGIVLPSSIQKPPLDLKTVNAVEVPRVSVTVSNSSDVASSVMPLSTLEHGESSPHSYNNTGTGDAVCDPAVLESLQGLDTSECHDELSIVAAFTVNQNTSDVNESSRKTAQVFETENINLLKRFNPSITITKATKDAADAAANSGQFNSKHESRSPRRFRTFDTCQNKKRQHHQSSTSPPIVVKIEHQDSDNEVVEMESISARHESFDLSYNFSDFTPQDVLDCNGYVRNTVYQHDHPPPSFNFSSICKDVPYGNETSSQHYFCFSSGVGRLSDRNTSCGEGGSSSSSSPHSFLYSGDNVDYAHRRRYDHSGRNLTCSICDKTFEWASLLVTHLRVHTGEKPFRCPKCSYRSTQKGNLQRHMLSKHPDEPSLDQPAPYILDT